MRRKVIARLMAVILCALMVLSQVGLTVRDAAMDQETVVESPTEGSVQQTQEVQDGEDQGNSMPAESAESVDDPSVPTEQEGNSTDTAAPSEGASESEEASARHSTP